MRGLCCACALALFAALPLGARDLIIGAVPEKPLKWEENGRPVGIDIEIIDSVLRELGVNYRVVFERSGSRLERDTRTGRYDMALSFSRTDERERDFLFLKTSHIDLPWHFFCREKDRLVYRFETLMDLRGLVIGATRGVAYTDDFWDAAARGVYTLDLSSDNGQQIPKLLARRFDLVPLNTIVALYEAKVGGYMDTIAYLSKPLKVTPYYNIFSRNSDYPDLAALVVKYDKVLARKKAEGTVAKIIAKY